MTPHQFRRLALGMPEAVESSHMGHPDFRVGKKVFATLGYPDSKSGMVKLSADQQAMLVSTRSVQAGERGMGQARQHAGKSGKSRRENRRQRSQDGVDQCRRLIRKRE